MTTLAYFATASLYLVVFYICYWSLLRQHTFFTLNRAYLLASIIFSLILPFVELPIAAGLLMPINQVTLPTIVVGDRLIDQSNGWSIGVIIGLIYLIGAGFMALKLGITIKSVFRIVQRGIVEEQKAYMLVRLPDEAASHIPSFSFGRYLVLNYSDGLMPSSALLHHEEAHIRQYHTVDILILEVVRIFFWFNPVLWLYKISLQEVHEFLADRAAIYRLSADNFSEKQIQPSYAQQLVAYAFRVPITALTTPFAAKSTLKLRLLMLQKPLTHRRALLSYILVLPIMTCLWMCTQTENDLPLSVQALTSSSAAARKSVKVDGEIFTVVEHQPEFPGGMEQLGKYIESSLRYPAAARKVNAEGRVFVSFIVSKTGEVTDVKILKGLGFGIDEEASRIVSQMPRWIPARQNGQLVNVRYNLPINFQINDEADKQARNDFWRDMSKYKIFTLDGKKTNKAVVRSISEQALKDDVHISFFIYKRTSTVAFSHVDS